MANKQIKRCSMSLECIYLTQSAYYVSSTALNTSHCSKSLQILTQLHPRVILPGRYYCLFPIFSGNSEAELQISHVTWLRSHSQQAAQPGSWALGPRFWTHAIWSSQGNANSSKTPFSLQQIGTTILNIGNIKCW